MEWEFGLLEMFQTLHRPWLDAVMILITSLGNGGFVWVALGVLFLCFKKTRRMGMAMAISLVLGLLVGNVCIKNLVARSRPCWIRPEVEMLISVPKDFSFPSGHTMASFEGAMSIWYCHKKWGAAALILAGLIACSRMYLFVHFPTDILAGLLLGLLHAWIARKLVECDWRIRRDF